jgi:hypothetical protein
VIVPGKILTALFRILETRTTLSVEVFIILFVRLEANVKDANSESFEVQALE